MPTKNRPDSAHPTTAPPSPSFRNGTSETTASSTPAVAVVDDDPVTRRILRAQLERAGHAVREFESGGALLERGTEGVAVACIDLGLDDMDGLDLIPHIRGRDPEVAVVVVTAKRDVDSVVRAMSAGAYDFITKPFDVERVLPAVSRGVERWVLARRVKRLEAGSGGDSVLPSFVGSGPAVRELARQVERVLESEVTVCLFGESGSGKEVVAQAIHTQSSRGGPFVALNCAAIPASLQESELFGHERGAFTGAVQSHKGRFEQARGGTLFLDELGEMSLATQASLLRALQERTIRRVGGTADVAVDVRIIGATHRDLRAEVEAGRFREDLYFRLVVYPIQVPPLRARSEDLPALIAHFVHKLAADGRSSNVRFSAEALAAMHVYTWPGNVRELQNVVHRCLLAADGDEVRFGDLPPEVRATSLPKLERRDVAQPAPGAGVRSPILAEGEVVPLVELERRAIQHALQATKGNIGKAAKLLGIGRTTLYRKLAALDIPFEIEPA
jgi:DNA-binding NtrC family response regulator